MLRERCGGWLDGRGGEGAGRGRGGGGGKRKGEGARGVATMGCSNSSTVSSYEGVKLDQVM